MDLSPNANSTATYVAISFLMMQQMIVRSLLFRADVARHYAYSHHTTTKPFTVAEVVPSEFVLDFDAASIRRVRDTKTSSGRSGFHV